jgi:AraC-like DNA-binding protein
MIIQVPEHFLKREDILQFENLSFLYYFNRNKTEKIHVQLNKHMLLHVFNGSKIISNDGAEHTVSSEQSVFMSKGQYFMSEILSFEKSHFDGIMVFFDDTFLFSIFNKYENLKKHAQAHNSNKLCIIENSSALHETMLSTKSYLERQSDGSTLVKLKFEEIFLQLLQSNSSHEIVQYFQSLYATGIFKFKDLLENNVFLNVEEMIHKSGLSEMQFRKTFKQVYGHTPKEWLLNQSLHKAKNLLSTKELNVTEVCFECGFHSISWFIKSFKKEFGITPKKYQQNC